MLTPLDREAGGGGGGWEIQNLGKHFDVIVEHSHTRCCKKLKTFLIPVFLSHESDTCTLKNSWYERGTLFML